MARRHDSDSGDESPAERRSRHDRKPSSRSNNRRSDSPDSDRGRRGRHRDDSVRVRDRTVKVDEFSGSDREGDDRRKARSRHSEEEIKERKREDSPRVRDMDNRRGKIDEFSGSDREGNDRRRARNRHSEEEMKERKRDDKRRGKIDEFSGSDREGDDRRGEERRKARNRNSEEEIKERKREDIVRVSDGEGDGDVERKRRRHDEREEGEVVVERGKRDRRHRRDRDRDHESSEEEERSRRGRERNGKSRNEDRRRNDDEDDGRRGRRDRRELKESNRKVEEEDKARDQPKVVELNPVGDVATLGRTGGVYIPPFKLARMMKEVEDKSSAEYQRLTWDALRKSINGLVNKVNGTNIKNIIPELLGENLIRGRGLFCRAVMKSQFASPGFTHVFAALVAVVNTKFPQIGDLLLRRIVLQLRRAYKRNDKPQLLAAVKFVAHLVNQQVAHELIALELLTILLDQPTDDSVEVAVGFVTECGAMLQDLSPKGLHGIFERFRGILHEGEIDKRVQFLIEGLFAIRKAKFQGYPAIRPELDLVEPEDQLTHEISIIDEEVDQEISLDVFKPDPDYLENEKRYEELKKSILGEESEEEEGSDEGSESDDEDRDEDEQDEEERMEIQDQTETNLVNLRRTIYLTIMSSVDFEEAGHKLLKIKLEPGQEMELCIMLLECCSQERTYLRYYGLLGQRFCMINKVHQENFETCFVQQYSMIHRLETNKLRNVAKFFAHLLGTFALPWHVLSYIRLTEEDTTSSSRIFIKILFQEMSEHLGIRLLNERLNDPTMQDSLESIFPKDNPRNTRFAINFFTSIGLGGITENLREYLKNMPRLIMQQQKEVSEDESGSGSDSGSESESESAKSESSSDRERRKRRKR